MDARTQLRIKTASKAALIHLLLSSVVALLAAFLVFTLWYPYPYAELSGGRELFILVVFVDVVCGPLLTMVLFTPEKSHQVLRRDLSFIALLQLLALGYGLMSVWQARPLFLVAEVDRFKVIAGTQLSENFLNELPSALQPHWFAGPTVVAIREPLNDKERETVLLEASQGGRDYAERPEFYLPYEREMRNKTTRRAKPLTFFLKKVPSQLADAKKLAISKSADITQLLYLPVVGRQDWVAVLDKQGEIQGFLKGDGF